MEIAPTTLDAIKDGLDRYGPRVWSSMMVKRLEDDCHIFFRADGIPEYLVEDESPQKGKEVNIPYCIWSLTHT